MERIKKWIAPSGLWKPGGRERTINGLNTARIWIRKNHRAIVTVTVTMTMLAALTYVLARQAYLTRGGFAVGGEWGLIPATILYFIIRWIDREDRKNDR